MNELHRAGPRAPSQRASLLDRQRARRSLLWLAALCCGGIIGCCYLPPAPAPSAAPAVGLAPPTVPGANGPSGGPSVAALPLRGATDEIERARVATAAHDAEALRPLLSPDAVMARYALTATESTSAADTAIASWRAHPEILDRMHEALEHCAIEVDDDMQFVSCEPPLRSGSVTLMWANDVDTDDFRLYALAIVP